MKRRTFIRAGAAAPLAATLGPRAFAQNDYPSRPVRIVVGFSAGGGVDLVARPLAQRLGEALGQATIVENKAGANGNLAAMYVATGVPADGYTLLQMNSAMATNNPFLYKSGVPNYLEEFTPITGITETPQAVIVPASLGVKTLKEFVALARAPKTEMNFASGGVGTLAHIVFELFKKEESLQMVHVPYKGTGPAIQDMLAGRMHLMIDNVSQVKGQVESGKLRVLAVTGPQRVSYLPDVPTTAEAGFPKLLAIGWQALLAPAKTPPQVLQKLRTAARSVVDKKDWTDFMAERGAVAKWASPETVTQRIKDESAVWGEVIRTAGITAD
ncbi:Bug family tripartite tricarboxylate transporter substrate binding protein [Variovorax sp.]|uniref:Bug family tripartite tricarboxylate transporter substrate binding protein n=1 Tax=Variovorax sp. TaxID=1871043 RepID=UPI001226F37E|nr:tripartite tricarboxylate transporter substrate binding protein [Variovorax sp.]TAJ60384.1 MAG: tripartite tricarboxylate transporter substrate binding protein [Variovorax sp.]